MFEVDHFMVSETIEKIGRQLVRIGGFIEISRSGGEAIDEKGYNERQRKCTRCHVEHRLQMTRLRIDKSLRRFLV